MIRINLSRLPAEKKQFFWNWIKDNKPALAELLSGEASRLAQKTFSADVVVELKASELEDVKKKFALVRPESV